MKILLVIIVFLSTVRVFSFDERTLDDISSRLATAERQKEYLLLMLDDDENLRMIMKDLNKDRLALEESWISTLFTERQVPFNSTEVRKRDIIAQLIEPQLTASLIFGEHAFDPSVPLDIFNARNRDREYLSRLSTVANRLMELQRPWLLRFKQKNLFVDSINEENVLTWFIYTPDIQNTLFQGAHDLCQMIIQSRTNNMLESHFLKMPSEYLELLVRFLSWTRELSMIPWKDGGDIETPAIDTLNLHLARLRKHKSMLNRIKIGDEHRFTTNTAPADQ